MDEANVHWAGVPFWPLFHHDGRFFRRAGLYGFVARDGEHRTLLYVDHAENIATATANHRLWADALALGFNELNVNVHAAERIDRLVLRAHIIKRCEPLLNLLEEGGRADTRELPADSARQYGSASRR